MSSSKRMKHIHHRCFLVKDKVDCGELEIQHEGTDKMWSDVLTKPEQGRPLYIMRAKLMNCPVDYDGAIKAVLIHPKLLPYDNEDATTSAFDKAVSRKQYLIPTCQCLNRIALSNIEGVCCETSVTRESQE